MLYQFIKMSQRNFIEEIEDYQSRLTSDNPRTELARQRTAELFASYNFINDAILNYEANFDFDFNTNEKKEVLKYYPLGIVASIQGYFKLAIKDLIETGDPFKSNAANFERELKDLSIEEILAIEDKRLSTADFVSHLVNLNSMNKINDAMNRLSDVEEDFFDIIKASRVYFRYDNNRKEYKDEANDIFKSLYKVFRLRNIIAHEVTADLEVFKSNLKKYIIHADLFLYACENEIFRSNKLC